MDIFLQAIQDQEAANGVGCVNQYSYYITYGYRALCLGSLCGYNNNCESGCCSGYAGYCQLNSWCDGEVSLAWLWWMLASICLVLCIVSMVLGAKRRRRQMELAVALHEAHHEAHCSQPNA